MFQIQINSLKHTNISSYIILFYHVIELGMGVFISKNIFDIQFKTMYDLYEMDIDNSWHHHVNHGSITKSI